MLSCSHTHPHTRTQFALAYIKRFCCSSCRCSLLFLWRWLYALERFVCLATACCMFKQLSVSVSLWVYVWVAVKLLVYVVSSASFKRSRNNHLKMLIWRWFVLIQMAERTSPPQCRPPITLTLSLSLCRSLFVALHLFTVSETTVETATEDDHFVCFICVFVFEIVDFITQMLFGLVHSLSQMSMFII